MDKGKSVEGREDHIHLPVDIPEEGGHGEGKDTIPEPVGRRSEGYGFGADLGREDFGFDFVSGVNYGSGGESLPGYVHDAGPQVVANVATNR